MKHFLSILNIFIFFKLKFRPFLFLYRLSYYELINFIHQNLNIKVIYETMSDISKVENVISNKKYKHISIFYSCNHFTNQIYSQSYDENYPEPIFRRFSHDQVLVWNEEEKNS